MTNRIRERISDFIPRNRTAAAAVLTAGVLSFVASYFSAGSYDFIVLWLLGAATAAAAVHGMGQETPPDIFRMVSAWILLAGAFLGFGSEILPWNWAVFIAFLSFCAFHTGIFATLKLCIPFFLLFIAGANQAYFVILFSYPLRYISSGLAFLILVLSGQTVRWTGTNLVFGKTEIAVTAACSGIEQLEVMLLLGFFLTLAMHRTFLPRLFHFLTILPALVLANSLRIAAVVLLYPALGEKVLAGAWHEWFGFASVATAFLLFFLFGFAFSSGKPEKGGLQK